MLYGVKSISGIVYMMFAVSLICAINNKKVFGVAKIAFEKVLFWRKNKDCVEFRSLF